MSALFVIRRLLPWRLEARQKALREYGMQFNVKHEMEPDGFILQFHAIRDSLGRVDAGMGKMVEALDGKIQLAHFIPSGTNIDGLRILLSLYKLADKVLSGQTIEISVIKTAIEKCTYQQSAACLHPSETVNCLLA